MDAEQVLNHVIARFDAPAYVRRARRVEQAYRDLIDRASADREKLLPPVRERLGELLAVLDAPPDLGDLAGHLGPVEPAAAPRWRAWRVRGRWRRFAEAARRFNDSWRERLRRTDLSAVNAERDDYNRYYLIEKECALRSPALARQGYHRLPPVTAADLERALPLLPDVEVPRRAARPAGRATRPVVPPRWTGRLASGRRF